MTKEELQRIKDIACDFRKWMDENCIDDVGGRAYLIDDKPNSYNNVLMTYEELFDYFVHEMLTNILIEDKTKLP